MMGAPAPAAAPPTPRAAWLDASQPLWLPQGSIRALLTFLLAGTVSVMFFIKNSAPEALVALAVMAVRDYFTYRQAETAQTK